MVETIAPLSFTIRDGGRKFDLVRQSLRIDDQDSTGPVKPKQLSASGITCCGNQAGNTGNTGVPSRQRLIAPSTFDDMCLHIRRDGIVDSDRGIGDA